MAGSDQPLPESISPPRPLYPFASRPQPRLWGSGTTPELQLIDSMSLRLWGLLASRGGYLLDSPAPFSTSALGLLRVQSLGRHLEPSGCRAMLGVVTAHEASCHITELSLGMATSGRRHLGERVAPGVSLSPALIPATLDNRTRKEALSLTWCEQDSASLQWGVLTVEGKRMGIHREVLRRPGSGPCTVTGMSSCTRTGVVGVGAGWSRWGRHRGRLDVHRQLLCAPRTCVNKKLPEGKCAH